MDNPVSAKNQASEAFKGLPTSAAVKFPIGFSVPEPVTLPPEIVAKIQKPEIVTVPIDKPNFNASLLRADAQLFDSQLLFFAEQKLQEVLQLLKELKVAKARVERELVMPTNYHESTKWILQSITGEAAFAVAERKLGTVNALHAALGLYMYQERLFLHHARTIEFIRETDWRCRSSPDPAAALVDIVANNVAEFVPLLSAMNGAKVKYGSGEIDTLFDAHHRENISLLTPQGMPEGNPVPVAMRQ